MTGRSSRPTWRNEAGMYLRYILALFSAGRPVPVFDAQGLKPRSVDSWSPDEQRLLVDEGRRQLDRQVADLYQIQTRAQIVLTTGIALGVGWASMLSSIFDASGLWQVAVMVLWITAGVLIVLTTLGAAALVSVRADFGMIHATLLSLSTPPVLDALAAAYARTVRIGHNTIATRLGLLRISVLLILAAAAALGLVWLASRAGA